MLQEKPEQEQLLQQQQQQQEQEQEGEEEEEEKKKNKNKSGLEPCQNCEAAQKPNCGALTRTYVVCHRREATLAVPNLCTHCHVSFTLFSACDSIHKHPCLTLVLCGRLFAICPPLSRYPQHSAFSDDLITLSASLCCSGPSSFPTVTLFKPVLPTQTPQLDSHKASPACEALQYFP